MRAADLQLDTVTVEQTDRVLVARVSDPPYNFMTARMQKDLDALTIAVDADNSIGAVILTGGIEHRYITHFDIEDILATSTGRVLPHGVLSGLLAGVSALPAARDIVERSPISGLLSITRFNDVVLRIMRSPAVYLAAIGGPCGGGGLELSVCFDVRVAADDDHTGFMLPELLIGLTTTVGGQRLAQLIGPSRALEMLLQGRQYSPREALDMGLLNRVVPAGRLMDETMELAQLYSRRNRATVAAQKQIFNEHHALSPADSLRHEGATSAISINAAAAHRALQEWVDRRGDGDSVFLTEPDPWVRGDAVSLNARD
ncbi:enoyl-CoA hydratase/isomerase family protein [Mycobacterium sp. 236(2023)]|uniref:enoyl-CoA hydratase/isomerase family protein n=1 Tax=Mycobacterium sp. 236(2023) TaxID=3038163 RepID=UPI002414EDE6|nr:enoyl-CoA hydratase/isomerase family protein [Mycobacterium sp. 236(2023)]MDG4667255.1 enoyl-CoA hydratase/isomerase family protein [Mycobacterium sp. 236(2023)]